MCGDYCACRTAHLNENQVWAQCMLVHWWDSHMQSYSWSDRLSRNRCVVWCTTNLYSISLLLWPFRMGWNPNRLVSWQWTDVFVNRIIRDQAAMNQEIFIFKRSTDIHSTYIVLVMECFCHFRWYFVVDKHSFAQDAVAMNSPVVLVAAYCLPRFFSFLHHWSGCDVQAVWQNRWWNGMQSTRSGTIHSQKLWKGTAYISLLFSSLNPALMSILLEFCAAGFGWEKASTARAWLSVHACFDPPEEAHVLSTMAGLGKAAGRHTHQNWTLVSSTAATTRISACYVLHSCFAYARNGSMPNLLYCSPLQRG